MAIPPVVFDPSIRFVNNITWGKVSQLNEIPVMFASQRIYKYSMPHENNRNLKDANIIDLKTRLNDLQDDLNRYNPSLIQRIINFFTGRLFTICRLRNALPELIKLVNAVAKTVIDGKSKADAKKKQEDAQAKAAEDARQKEEAKRLLKQQRANDKAKQQSIANAKLKAKGDAAKAAIAAASAVTPKTPISSSPTPKKSPAVPPSPTTIATTAAKADKAFVEAITAYLDDTQDEDAIESGDEIRVNVSNLPITPEELAYKTNLVAQVKKMADNADPAQAGWSPETVEKVRKYVRTLLLNLALGRNVPLPRWYHATGRHGDSYGTVEKIVTSKYLHQLGAPRGYGTYFSSLDEHEHVPSYGDHTFIFDEGAFSEEVLNPKASQNPAQPKEVQVHYFPGDPISSSKASEKSNRNSNLWLRVRCIGEDVKTLIRNGQDRSGYSAPPVNCVPVSTSTVAFMATQASYVDEMRKKMKEINTDLKKKFQPTFNVSVLNREEVDFIRHVFDTAETQYAPTPNHMNADEQEKITKKQNSLLKYRDNGKLITIGGRYVPSTWQPHDERVNSYLKFPRHMYHLTHMATNPTAKLEASFKTPLTREEILSLCEPIQTTVSPSP